MGKFSLVRIVDGSGYSSHHPRRVEVLSRGHRAHWEMDVQGSALRGQVTFDARGISSVSNEQQTKWAQTSCTEGKYAAGADAFGAHGPKALARRSAGSGVVSVLD